MRTGVACSLLAAGALWVVGCTTARDYQGPRDLPYATHHGAGAVWKGTLRVVTFNVELGRRIDQAVLNLTRSTDLRTPDILALQEMDSQGVARIAEALGMNSVYFPASIHHRSRRQFGNAILSPWPIDEARQLVLPHRSWLTHMQRSATVATVHVADRRLRVYSVHLETPLRLRPSTRRQQARAVADDAALSPDPVLIAGDLNSRSLAEYLHDQGFTWVTRDIRHTASWMTFDHLLARGLALARPDAVGVGPDLYDASDHRPVWAILELDENDEAGVSFKRDGLRAP